MKVKKADNGYGIAVKFKPIGFGFGLLPWPWVILDFPGLNFWDRLCSAQWFWNKSGPMFQVRYLWFTFCLFFNAR
jgi:hypothetical protein